jgi:hypothetical protein
MGIAISVWLIRISFSSKNVDVWIKSTTVYKLSINKYRVIPVG